jgi:hypothetical protein
MLKPNSRKSSGCSTFTKQAEKFEQMPASQKADGIFFL